MTYDRIEQKKLGLQVKWPDATSGFFHYVWLRDCCHCEICGDSYSSNRFLHPNDVPMDVVPESVELVGPNSLRIVWRQDHHHSTYDLDWLKRHQYSGDALDKRVKPPVVWDSRICEHLPAVRYRQASKEAEHRLDCLRKLRDYGFVIVRGGPETEQGAERVAGLIGEVSDSAYGRFFDLTPGSKYRTAGNTMHPVPPHTDEAFRYSPPGVNVLHCIRHAESGGESILVDGFKLGEVLRESEPRMFRLLTKQPQPYHRIVDENNLDQRARAPVFTLNEHGLIVGFRFHPRSRAPFDVPEDLFLEMYAANRKLCDMMFDKRYQAIFKLKSGDAVLFDNHRVMHSRAGFSDPDRKLRICNVSREQFHEQLRLTASRLGFIEESQQILSAGVIG